MLKLLTLSGLFVTLAASGLVYPHQIDMGSVFEDKEEVTKEVILGNDSGQAIKILSIETGCGCTVAKLEKKEILPGEEIKLLLSIDVTGKRGAIKKKVTIKTSQEEYTITISLKVIKRVGAHSEGLFQKKIFAPPCASCHSKDEGKMAKELFSAICAFCHGPHGSGASAPALTRLSFLRSVDDDQLFEIIARGREEKGMPAFLESNGGPLSKKQVKSLIPYLRRDQIILEQRSSK